MAQQRAPGGDQRPAFERKIKGFAMDDAVLTGVETRTSSLLRITRGRGHRSINVAGLYPAGEGAGYAGGIMSAVVDRIEVAESGLRHLLAAANRGAKSRQTKRKLKWASSSSGPWRACWP